MGVVAKGAFILAVLLAGASAGAQEACPDGQCPVAVEAEFGQFGAGGWHAARVRTEDGGSRCAAYAQAASAEPDRGMWLFIYDDSLRFRPADPLPDDESVNINTGDVTMPLAVGQGSAFAPLTYPMLARAMGEAKTVIIHVGVRRPAEVQEFLVYPMDGFRDAFARLARECGFDAGPVLGED